jgi:enoyl-CoA hydratase/carnithine racemase
VSSTVRYDVDGGVATITLDRPEALNALTVEMKLALREAVEKAAADDAVRAVVLTGAGRAFCVGQDLREHADGLAAGDTELTTVREHYNPIVTALTSLPKPVIAAVNGMACGGAFYLLGEVDILIAADHATFFDPHVTYGLVAAIEPIAMSYRMHLSDVLRMSLLGLHERMTADRALVCGLVTEIVEVDALVVRAQQIAAAIASQPPLAVQGTVKAIWQSLDAARTQALGTALLYTQVGNPLGTAQLPDGQAQRPKPWRR